MDRLARAAAVMRVLSHPHRLRICELLIRGQVPVKAVARHLRIHDNAASQHLSIMKAHGILDARRCGKTVYYQVIDPRPGWLLECIRGHAPGGEAGTESDGHQSADDGVDGQREQGNGSLEQERS